MSRSTVAVVIGGVALAVGMSLGAAERRPTSSPDVLPPSGAHNGKIEVHVAGWVVSPGVVVIPDPSIVADAIEAAGGLRPGAQVLQINLAAPIRSGDQIVVPGPEASDSTPSAGNGLVLINRATVSELQSLPGVGPVLAERIIAYREENGPFQQVEDLLDVPGIGEAKLASIRDLVRVP